MGQRTKCIGELMRSKGFIWLATSQACVGTWQLAGNVLRVQPAGPWLCHIREKWEGTPYEVEAFKKIRQDNGKEWPHGDRCQEIVFIGKDLNHEIVQSSLDQSLLTKEEMKLGPEGWEESLRGSDFNITLPNNL